MGNLTEEAKVRAELYEEIKNIRCSKLPEEIDYFNCFKDDIAVKIIFGSDELKQKIILEEIICRGGEGYRYLLFIIEQQRQKAIVSWFFRLSIAIKIQLINFLIRECSSVEEVWVNDLISYMTEKELNYSTEKEPLILITSIRCKRDKIIEYIIRKGADLSCKCKCYKIMPADIYNDNNKNINIQIDYLSLAQECFANIAEEYGIAEAGIEKIFEINPFSEKSKHKDIWNKYILIMGIDLEFEEGRLIDDLVAAKTKNRNYYKRFIKNGIKIGEAGEIVAGIISATQDLLRISEYIISTKTNKIIERNETIEFQAREHEDFETTFRRTFGYKNNICIYANSKVIEQKKQVQEEREYIKTEEVVENEQDCR